MQDQFTRQTPEKSTTESKKNPSKGPIQHQQLTQVALHLSRSVNESIEREYGIKNFVDSSLKINPYSFDTAHGGIYSQEEIKRDEDDIYRLDVINSVATNPNVQEFYRKTHQVHTVEEIVEKHKEIKDQSKSNHAEIIITAVLHKVLGGRFIVVRSATHDDYKHGMDNLIIDKVTGAVICAFDEVLENDGDAGKISKKVEKTQQNIVRGGNEVKYGLSLTHGKLKHAKLRNVPVFYLTLKSKDLAVLTGDLHHMQTGISDAEKQLFNHLIASIKEQHAALQNLDLSPVMREKLTDFEESLRTLQSFTFKN